MFKHTKRPQDAKETDAARTRTPGPGRDALTRRQLLGFAAAAGAASLALAAAPRGANAATRPTSPASVPTGGMDAIAATLSNEDIPAVARFLARMSPVPREIGAR